MELMENRPIAVGFLLKVISFMKVRVLDSVATKHSIALAIARMPRLDLFLKVFPDSARLQRP